MYLKTEGEFSANQDKELAAFGLYRYKIPGDGNCLFRAVAFSMKLDQEKSHPVLREATVSWMQEHSEELLASHVIDSTGEIEEISQLGSWPGQAALIALANVLGVNIAVFYGGDKVGSMDVQHFKPYSETNCGTIKLLYMFDGHYDAVVDKPNLPNPEYELWLRQRANELEESEALAKELERAEDTQKSSNISKQQENEEISPLVLNEVSCNNSEEDQTVLLGKEEDCTNSQQNKVLPIGKQEHSISIPIKVLRTKPQETRLEHLEKEEFPDPVARQDTVRSRGIKIPIIRESSNSAPERTSPPHGRLVLRPRSSFHEQWNQLAPKFNMDAGFGPTVVPSLFFRPPSDSYV